MAQFDKPAIFAQIAEEDQTPFAERLVAHNRLPEGQRKLGIREMVLTEEERNAGGSPAPIPVAVANGRPAEPESVQDSQDVTMTPTFKSSATGRPVATLNARTWGGFLGRARPSGLLASVVENAARGAATVCLPIVGQARKKRAKEGKVKEGADVLVLVGDHETGAFGLACARILQSYGIDVATLVASKSHSEVCESHHSFSACN